MDNNNPWNLSCDVCESVKSEYPCPCINCSIHSESKIIKWIHPKCGGNFRLYKNGREKCQDCGFEDFFCNSPHECSNAKLSSFKIRSILQLLVGKNENVNILFWINLKSSLNMQRKIFPTRFSD